jgi:hypothetical protein
MISMRTRLLIAMAAAVVVCPAAYYLAPWKGTRERAVREALYDELRTVSLENCTLRRYGSEHDGGYLLCENLVPGIQVAYSYGIGSEDNWGCDVSRQFGVTVHQYDCFTPHRPLCEGGRFVFHNQCVGGTRETIESRPFDTIAAQIASNGDAGKRLLVKIDVEGAEWDALFTTPDDVLDTIDQMAMELHGTNESRFVELIRRLKTRFYLVNLHFNNWTCTAETAPLPAVAFQVLWVNKRLGVFDSDASPSVAMSPLNAPDNPNGPDCQLPARSP